MKKIKGFVVGCNIVGAICFGIVSYGHFYRDRMALGTLFAVLTIAQLAMAVINFSVDRKQK